MMLSGGGLVWAADRSAFRGALDLPVFEFDGRKPSEDGDRDLELAAGGIDLVHAAGEVGEGAVGDLDLLADVVPEAASTRALISSISLWRSGAGFSPPTKPMTPAASFTK